MRNFKSNYLIIKNLSFLIVLFCCLLGCKKDKSASPARVDIYELKSFTSTIDQSASHNVDVITNAVLNETPLIKDEDIKSYSLSSQTFELRKNVGESLKSYNASKGFAITINHQPVYYGKFQSAISSSLPIGQAYIYPIGSQILVGFSSVEGNEEMKQLDKRNDPKIIEALRNSGRLRP